MDKTMIYPQPVLIAEIGCNHKGDFDTAIEMIRTAKEFCGVDAVKFQKRNNKELLTVEQYNAPHPYPGNAYGDTYGKHREFLEFNTDQHQELKKYCDALKVQYSTSVWDLSSAKEIVKNVNPVFIKIPSACNNHTEMLSWLCENYNGDIHVSLGMTTRQEEKELLNIFQKYRRMKSVVLYCCTSGYPVPFKDMCLLEIQRLKNAYAEEIKEIGFSGHHNGIAVDVAAYTLGAQVIERHFTLNRTWKGTDHAASLEPDGMRRLKRNLDATWCSLTYKDEEILQIEKEQREKLKFRRG